MLPMYFKLFGNLCFQASEFTPPFVCFRPRKIEEAFCFLNLPCDNMARPRDHTCRLSEREQFSHGHDLVKTIIFVVNSLYWT